MEGRGVMWRTHVLGGVCSLWLLAPVLGGNDAANVGVLAAVAAFGALLPDLDAAQSKIRSLGAFGIQPFNPVGAAVSGMLGHRGFLHSPKALVFLASCAAVLSMWIGSAPAAALWLGYASHLALDACTKSGIPGRSGRIFLVPPFLRVVTGSPNEDAYFMLLAAAASALLLVHLSATSY
jgi:inner membrane protein